MFQLFRFISDIFMDMSIANTNTVFTSTLTFTLPHTCALTHQLAHLYLPVCPSARPLACVPTCTPVPLPLSRLCTHMLLVTCLPARLPAHLSSHPCTQLRSHLGHDKIIYSYLENNWIHKFRVHFISYSCLIIFCTWIVPFCKLLCLKTQHFANHLWHLDDCSWAAIII